MCFVAVKISLALHGVQVWPSPQNTSLTRNTFFPAGCISVWALSKDATYSFSSQVFSGILCIFLVFVELMWRQHTHIFAIYCRLCLKSLSAVENAKFLILLLVEMAVWAELFIVFLPCFKNWLVQHV